MTVFTLISKATGTKNGKNWYNIVLRSKTATGSKISTFWLSESVWNCLLADGIMEDDQVYVGCELDAELHFAITTIEKCN